MKIYKVIFKNNNKTFNFSNNNIEVNINDYVVVETERGLKYGKVIAIEENTSNIELEKIVRKSTESDYNKYLSNLGDAKNALLEIRRLANNLDLNMQFVDCEYTFDRKQLQFNFIADKRIDFRELVKQLANKYKTRIELHQIGVRDKAKEVGGLGMCGMGLCCATFLDQMDTISINMAKNQNIALNPSKINGVCGRLLCCLSYEDKQYKECRKKLPNVGEYAPFEDKKGRVISVDILNQKYKIDVNGEIKEVEIKGCSGCK